MLRTVVAVERDGFNARVLTLHFDVPSKGFDLVAAVRKAATDYCKTENGKKVYEYNCSAFNWADFDMSVPQEFCEKNGFRKVDSTVPDIEVDLDEQLVDEFEIEGADNDWRR